ncbi:MAG TPA: hypothetical protein D7H91_04470 [Candidatus Poseidoniales archaeon]|nr:MAG TPA: hypothetical protein D7H91_04470 [Candidatus Poseidoniales archaeon]
MLQHIDETCTMVVEGQPHGLEVRFDGIHRLNQVLQSAKTSIERCSAVFELNHIDGTQQP